MKANKHKWQTSVDIGQPPFPLSFDSRVFSLGSCFAVNVSDKLESLKFKVSSNPFGIMYNPVSILKNIQLLSGNRKWSSDRIFHHQGFWRDYLFHSEISCSNRQHFIDTVESKAQAYNQILLSSDFIILTLGTAYAWKLKQTGELVSNCHKMSSKLFDRVLLSRETIWKSLEGIREIIASLCPEAGIVLTVSPVRHVRDGLVNNSRSKARLIDCVQSFAESYPSRVSYFPAYEIVMDELRDYRFYADDMLHPSLQAVSFITNSFLNTYLKKSEQDYIVKILQIQKDLEHRPSESGSPAHKAHLQRTLDKIYSIKNHLPELDFSDEINKIESLLT